MKFSGFKNLTGAAKSIRAAPDAAQRAAVRSVNSVTAKLATEIKREIASEISLPQTEVARNMRTISASQGMKNAHAMILVRRRGVSLIRFEALQLTKPAKRAKGDALRRIAPGRKAAGISVKVGRGRKTLRGAFLLPLRAGKVAGGNGLGVFMRDGRAGPSEGPAGLNATLGKYRWRGNIKHLYGPSPDQLFRRIRVQKIPFIKSMLAKAFASQLRYELTGSRK